MTLLPTRSETAAQPPNSKLALDPNKGFQRQRPLGPKAVPVHAYFKAPQPYGIAHSCMYPLGTFAFGV